MNRIVILGGGFGGAYTYRYLHKHVHNDPLVEIDLVDQKNYFLFTPLLHEVATGGLDPHLIVQPLRAIVGCCLNEFHMGSVSQIDTKHSRVVIQADGGTRELTYDKLVIAMGSETNFFGTPGAQEHCFTLKSLDDAIVLKNHCIRVVEQAAHITDPKERQRLLHFVIVGGGPTGVELAAELWEFLCDSLAEYYSLEHVSNDISITLVHRGAELLQQFEVETRQRAQQVLEKKGITLRLGVGATEITPDGVKLDTGEFLPTNTAVWVAGIQPASVDFDVEVKQDKAGRFVVDEFLRLDGFEDIYVIGDIAHAVSLGDSRPAPALAQVATKQANIVASNISYSMRNEPLEPFSYKSSGNLVSLGEWAAAGEIGRFRFGGHLAWFFWRTVYLSKILSIGKKLQVAVNWTLNLFAPRDISSIRSPEFKSGEK